MWTINIILLIYVRFAAGKLLGDHVCQMEEKYTVNVTETIIRNSTVRMYQWCLNVPPRCSFYTTKQVNVSQIVEKEITDLIEKCCPGFHENTTTNTCQLNCPDCKNGHCDNGKCLCFLGFKGDNCNKECDQMEWGRNCGSRCKCQKGTCNPQTGSCNCPAGWTGKECETPCPNGLFGSNCSESCTCAPEEKCHHVSGTCQIPITTSPSTTTIETSTETSTVNLLIFQNNGKFNTDVNGLVSLKPTQQTTSMPINDLPTDNNKDVIHTNSNYMPVQELTSVKQELNKDRESGVTSPMTKDGNDVLHQEAPLENYLNDEKSESSSDHSENKTELVSSASAATAVSLTIIIVAVIIVGVNRMRKIRKRQENKGGTTGVSTVSVYTHSIFHTPLPEPPPFENPVFATPIESNCSNTEAHRFETKVVCSMNFPTHSSKDSREYLYDHPPSTGSYRAASIPEPPDIDTSNTQFITHGEPVYDEIPSSMPPTLISEPPPSYKSSSLYMNTCAKTRF